MAGKLPNADGAQQAGDHRQGDRQRDAAPRVWHSDDDREGDSGGGCHVRYRLEQNRRQPHSLALEVRVVCDSAHGFLLSSKMSLGRNAETTQLGASTTSLILRSTETEQRA